MSAFGVLELESEPVDHGKLDSQNFAAAIGELSDSFKFTGEGSAKKVKVRRGVFEEAGKLITQLLAPTANR